MGAAGQEFASRMSALFGAFILAMPIIMTAIKDLINGKVYMNELVALGRFWRPWRAPTSRPRASSRSSCC